MTKKIDPVTVEIIGNYLLSVAEEVGIAIVKSSYSNNIKERRDLSSAVFDPEGNLIAQAEYVPMHLGSLIYTIKAIFDKYPLSDIHDGDVFAGNDPYGGGGSHLPDITIATPVFCDGKLLAWVANCAHHSDIGGKVPGSLCSDAIDIYQEGLRIPLLKICEEGKLNTAVIDLLMTNSRVPQERYGDLMAQIASNRVGYNRITDAHHHWGDIMVDCMYSLEDYTERRLRTGISKLADGEYYFEDYMDPAECFGNQPGKICVKVIKRGDCMHFDFTGSAKQVESPLNMTYNALIACVFYSVKTLIDPEAPTNAGISRTFDVTVEEGTIINCKNPAAVGQRIDTAQRVVDTIYGALATIVGNRAQAASSGACHTISFAGYDPKDKNHYVLYLEVIAGGLGAFPDMDGLSGAQAHMTNTSNLPVEALETEIPLLNVHSYGLLTNSGGAGKYRGGLAIARKYEILADKVICSILTDRQQIPPWGLEGGCPGLGGANILQRRGEEECKLSAEVSSLVLNKEDFIAVVSPGGGGYGNPYERDEEAVLTDVIVGKIDTREAERYGVIIDIKGGRYVINEAETKKIRSAYFNN